MATGRPPLTPGQFERYRRHLTLPELGVEGQRRLLEGRVCLIGDAAHAMPPSAGQGAALAMEDAMVLTQCLRDSADLPSAFSRYEGRRRPRVTAILRHARRNGSGKAVPGPISEWFRDRMLPLFLRLGEPAQTASYAHQIDWEARA